MHSALCIAVVAAASEATTAYEAPVETNAPPRAEVIVTNLPARWPEGAERVFVEVWCLDANEEPVVIAVNGGKGADGTKKGFHSVVEELPPDGSMGCSLWFGGLKWMLDPNVLSSVTVRVESGRPQRFGVSRIVFLNKGEASPSVTNPPRRHPRDAAEHAKDFADFKAECAKSDFVIGWATSMENVRPRGGFKWRKPDKVGVRLARGEYESVQILVAPNGKDLKGVTVQVEGDLNRMHNAQCTLQNDGASARQDAAPPGGPAAVPTAAGEPPTPRQLTHSPTPPLLHFAATNVAANVVGYTETIHPPPYVVRPPKGWKMKRPPCGWYPDPILDFQKSCDVSGDDVQAFWIRVKCPRDQEAGVYEGALVVSAEGVVPVRIPFSVRVNGFEVGRVAPLSLSISVQPWGPGTNSWRNAWRAHPMETCDFFADYFITFNRLYNGAPAWDMLKRLKDQGRLNMFNLGYVDGKYPGERGEADFRDRIVPDLLRRYERAKELGIGKQAHIFCCDEIRGDEFPRLTRAADDLHAAMPDVPVLTTAKDKLLGVDGSRLPNIDIFCPPTCWWNPTQVERARREGRQVWWYFCNDPASPWANMTLEGPPCEIRSLMGAQTQKFKPDGFLYYATCNWNAKEPIKEGPFTKWEPRSYGAYHGDGQWVCCGGPDNMFLPTIRLENFRDGIEDLWYVRTLEKLYAARRDEEMVPEEKAFKEGGEIAESDWCRRARELLAVPNDIVKSLREFSTDPDVIYRWRDAMANLIEAAK